jgi:tRNA threonylcarbamoyladenosine biosynthesis protein TsaB
MELAIDTSTDWGGLALSNEGSLIMELIWKPGRNHTTELFPNLDNILNSAGQDIQKLKAVYVAKGPGSFNGLRAGISAAKGIAFSLNIPLVAVSTLEIEAYPFAFTGLPICPIHDAGRGEIAAALYRMEDTWKCLQSEYLTTIEVLCEKTVAQTLFCGELPEAALDIISTSLGVKATIPGLEERLRRPGFLAHLGWQRLQCGMTDDAATLQPTYLRQPPITQRKKKY